MTKYFRTRWLWLIVSAILTGIPIIMGKVYYMVFDDYLMNSIANGTYGWNGSAHLDYTNIVYGAILKGLYAITPGVNWFAAALAAVLILSFASLHRSVWIASEKPAFLLFSLCANAVTVICFFTYTIVAFIACAAGCAVLCRNWLDERDPAFPENAEGILLLILGFMIRMQSFAVAGAVFFPIILQIPIKVLRRTKEQRKYLLRKLAASLAVLFVILCVLFGIDRMSYSSEVWKEYNSYNAARMYVVDYPAVSYKENKEKFREIGVSRTVYDMLQKWQFTEKRVFSEEMYQAVGEIQHGAYTPEFRMNYLKKNIQTKLYFLILLLPVLMLAAVFPIVKKRQLPALAAVCLITYCFFWYLLYIRLRIVLRVIIPVALAGMYAMVMLAGKQHSRGRKTASLCLCLVMFLAAGIFSKDYRDATWHMRSHILHDRYEPCREEIAAHPDDLYVLDAAVISDFYYRGIPVNEFLTPAMVPNYVRSGSWDSFSERYYRQLERFGSVDPDNLFSSLLESSQVHFVTHDPSTLTPFLEEISGHDAEPQVTVYPDAEIGFCDYS